MLTKGCGKVRFFKGRTAVLAALAILSGCGYSVPAYHARIKSQTSYANSRRTVTATTAKTVKNDDAGVVVKRGDTVYSLSRRYGVPIRAMIEINGLSAPYTLSLGQRLRLPPVATHTVVKGDTVYSISRRYGVDMSTLARQNNIHFPYAIIEGQILTLPGAVVRASYKVAAAPSPKKTSGAQKTAYKQPRKTAKSKSAIKLPTPPSRSAGRFAWPVKGRVTAEFGTAGGGRHNDGMNIKVAAGTPVKAAENGIVAYAGNELKGFGNLLLIKHADGWVTAYAHNRDLLVKRGQTVKRGEVIAKAGKTGSATEPQLHFEIRKGTKAVNPRDYLTL